MKMKKNYRRSPPREQLPVSKGKVDDVTQGVNPEESPGVRTKELATDQSIAARNLLYNPNQSTLNVIGHCADGINSIMGVLSDNTVENNEILISMVTRLMADGGTARIEGFNDKLKNLVAQQKESPRPEGYAKSLGELAEQCRDNMSEITSKARLNGPDGALARQGIMSFMGDLGGVERLETGFGPAYKGPLCEPIEVYNAYVEGLCNAQRKVPEKASKEEVKQFEEEFHRSRQETSLKQGSQPDSHGAISAPAHTKFKKKERAIAGTYDVKLRTGLLNTGSVAEDKLRSKNANHKTTLVNVAWPAFVVSKEVVEGVVEPVTGHVSGTFGEAAHAMNLFCGTPLKEITQNNPSGGCEHAVPIAALVSAGLISAGFHSAVEVFQPMSTFTTESTHNSMGPVAEKQMNTHAEALREYAKAVDGFETRPAEFSHGGHALTEEELKLGKEDLENKAQSIEDAATKSKDMISMLQGGGSLATLEVSRVMANCSSNPEVVFELYSDNTKKEEQALNPKPVTENNVDAAIQKAKRLGEIADKLGQEADKALQKAKQLGEIADKKIGNSRNSFFNTQKTSPPGVKKTPKTHCLN